MDYDSNQLLHTNIECCLAHLNSVKNIQSLADVYFFWLSLVTLVVLLHAKRENRLVVNTMYSDNIDGITGLYSLRNSIAHLDSQKILNKTIRAVDTRFRGDIVDFLKSNGYVRNISSLFDEAASVLGYSISEEKEGD